jgi:hypothetical protein
MAAKTIINIAISGKLAASYCEANVGDSAMFKEVWSQERYEEEYQRFSARFGEAPQTSMTAFMSWHYKIKEQFNLKLKTEGINWESDISDEYISLKNTHSIQSFLRAPKTSISKGDFYNLARKAIDEVFGDLNYLDKAYPKLKHASIKRKQETLIRLLNIHGIDIDDY